MIRTSFLAFAAAALFAAAPARAQPQPEFKIGFLATMTGPGGVTGAKTRDGLQLAIDQAGGKLGGLPTTLLVEDDQAGARRAQTVDDRQQVADRPREAVDLRDDDFIVSAHEGQQGLQLGAVVGRLAGLFFAEDARAARGEQAGGLVVE